MIKEDFLHHLWKYKLFSSSKLQTIQNESIAIVNSGTHNYNTGPDFFNSQLKISNQLWAGNVEIHTKSSDWYVHGHENDKNYDSVILHVVFEHDVDIHRNDNTVVPTLELKDYINKEVLNNYKQLFSSNQKWINCEKDIAEVDKFTVSNWIERLYIERLEQKSEFIQKLLIDSKNDWEAVLFKLLAKNFGLKVNGDAFYDLANQLDFSIIRKEQHDLFGLEALFFGHARMLEKPIEDQYHNRLKKEYEYLKTKYQLPNSFGAPFQFFRLRPNNFPTIRLAQFSALYHHQQNLFSKLMNVTEVNDYYQLFEFSVTEYWKTHYSFTSISKKSEKKLTKSFIDLLLINTIIPLKFMHLKSIDKLNETEILLLIKRLKSEKNTIIDEFKKLKITAKNALDSQALLQLKNNYCTAQKCLQCAIGNTLLQN